MANQELRSRILDVLELCGDLKLCVRLFPTPKSQSASDGTLEINVGAGARTTREITYHGLRERPHRTPRPSISDKAPGRV